MTAVGMGLLGLLVVWLALHTPSSGATFVAGPPGQVTAPTPTASPTPARATSRSDRSDARDKTSGPVLPESGPVSLSIPRIGVRSRLVDLGLDGDGAMEVPRDPSLAGWFDGSVTPGQLGPAVVAGHVTWNRAPAVFSRLGQLRRGDRVSVVRRDGRTAVFTVDLVTRYAKTAFPSDAVYGAIDHAGLRLITCGGTYDTVHHRYLDNVVVFASLIDVRR